MSQHLGIEKKEKIIFLRHEITAASELKWAQEKKVFAASVTDFKWIFRIPDENPRSLALKR